MLDSLTKLNSGNVDYEILLVNNNSTDNTEEVYNEFSNILPGKLRYIFESKQGLSFARNRALNEAKGEIVSFIDDDAVVEPDWLTAVEEAFSNYNATLVGGKSYLIYPHDPPDWLSPEWETNLSRIDYGEEPLVGTSKHMYGLNYSLLKKPALDLGGFNTEIGRIGKKLFSYEEVDMQNKIVENGGVVVYEPKAVVGHIVAPERLTKEWFKKRVYYDARSGKRLDLINQGKNKLLKYCLLVPIHYLNLIKSVIIRDCDKQELFSKHLTAIRHLGGFIEYLTWSFKRK